MATKEELKRASKEDKKVEIAYGGRLLGMSLKVLMEFVRELKRSKK